MSDKQLSWGCCSLGTDNDKDFIQCLKCKKLYHHGCLNIKSNTKIQTNWICLKCAKTKAGNNDETPIRSNSNRVNDSNITKRSHKRQALSSPASPSSPMSISSEEISKIVNGIFEKEMSNLLVNINKTITSTVSSYFKSIDNKIEDLQHSISFISTQYDDMKKQIDTYTEIIDKQKEDNVYLQKSVENLTNKINLMEQQARSNNVEIQCVPESRNENLVSIVKHLATTVGYHLNDSNISHCTRIAKMNTKSARPRSIVVQLNTPLTRDHLLAAVIKFNRNNPSEKLNSSHVGIAGDRSSIYVGEHLSSTNKFIHAAARRKAKELNYKHVWVRNGKIFMRKTDTSDYKVISSIGYLDKLS